MSTDSYCPKNACPPVPLADPEGNAKNLRGLPQRLNEMSEAQRGAVLDYYKSLPLSDLRERQRINTYTHGLAVKKGNTLVIANCAVTEQLLIDAIMAQQFPTN
jgi:hypothetical protein